MKDRDGARADVGSSFCDMFDARFIQQENPIAGAVYLDSQLRCSSCRCLTTLRRLQCVQVERLNSRLSRGFTFAWYMYSIHKTASPPELAERRTPFHGHKAMLAHWKMKNVVGEGL